MPPLLPGGLPPDLPLPGQQVGYVLRRALDHLHELDDDAGDLTVPGGDQVSVVCVSVVREWLTGLAIRTEAGERL